MNYQIRRVALAATGLLAGLAAATAFLCARPASSATPPGQQGNLGTAAAAAASLALQSGQLFTLADRQASDALRVIAKSNAPHSAGDELEWDYVQLRL